MIITYVAIVFLVAFFYNRLLYNYGQLWRAIPESKYQAKTKESIKPIRVSILIPFRNEANSLPNLIESLNRLNTFNIDVEVIFIDDHSTDDGQSYINDCRLPKKLIPLIHGTGKKEAIQLGWKHVSGEYIFQTDADCILPKNWIPSMISLFDNEVHFVSGPVLFHESKKIWNQLVAIDFMSLISIGAAHIQWKHPLMCNGANMAYRSALINSIELKSNRASGDDVFLLQSAFQKTSDGIRFCKDKQAIVYTKGPDNINIFWNQRLRWASKNNEYESKWNTIILIGVWVFNVIILISFLSFHKIGFHGGFFLVLIKLISELNFYSSYAQFMGYKKGLPYILMGQFLHIIYMVILPPLSQILSFTWKERVMKK